MNDTAAEVDPRLMRNARCFCATERSRYAIDAPWVEAGFLYATDGRILVSWPAPGVPDTVNAKGVPPVKDLGWDEPGEVHPLPDIGPQSMVSIHGMDNEGYTIDNLCPKREEAVEIAGKWIAPFYVRQLRLLGVTELTVTTKEIAPFLFSGPDGLRGLVMPIRK
jgi:hypothetical protein